MGQSPVIKSLEKLPFKEEALPVEFVLPNQLFEREQVAFDAPIPHDIDGTKPTLPKEALDNIAGPVCVSYRHSKGKCHLFLLQAALVVVGVGGEPGGIP